MEYCRNVCGTLHGRFAFCSRMAKSHTFTHARLTFMPSVLSAYDQLMIILISLSYLVVLGFSSRGNEFSFTVRKGQRRMTGK